MVQLHIKVHRTNKIGVSLVFGWVRIRCRSGTWENLQIDNLQRGLTSLLQPIPATWFLVEVCWFSVSCCLTGRTADESDETRIKQVSFQAKINMRPSSAVLNWFPQTPVSRTLTLVWAHAHRINGLECRILLLRARWDSRPGILIVRSRRPPWDMQRWFQGNSAKVGK